MDNLLPTESLCDRLNYIKIHAIYKMDVNDLFCAAVDLFVRGETYCVEFTLRENGQIDVHNVKRWYIG